jgi:hypothetical protein
MRAMREDEILARAVLAPVTNGSQSIAKARMAGALQRRRA